MGSTRPNSPVPFSQPGLVTIPLSFVVLVVVSLHATAVGAAHGAERAPRSGAE